jgi:hypothetical protein
MLDLAEILVLPVVAVASVLGIALLSGAAAPAHRLARAGSATLLAIVIAACAFRLAEGSRPVHIEKVVAISWSPRRIVADTPVGPAQYQARVFAVPAANGWSLRANVWMPSVEMFHDCGELGLATGSVDAVERFGTVAWRDDGLHLFDAGREVRFVPFSLLETHR